MTRVIVHAGFHKTGTSSLQVYLGQYRRAFLPWFDFRGMGDALHASAVAARIYAQKPFPWRLRALRRALRHDFAALPEAETLVLSREHFSGVMPGHRAWNGRLIQDFTRAGTTIGKVMSTELRRRFGPDTRVEFLYTIRDGEPWLRSVHGHLMNSRHLTDDFDAFRASFPAKIDLADQARQIAARVRPDALHLCALEDMTGTRFGPATAVLDLAGVPETARAKLPRAHRINTGFPSELRAEFLALNKSGKPANELRRVKDARINALREANSSTRRPNDFQ